MYIPVGVSGNLALTLIMVSYSYNSNAFALNLTEFRTVSLVFLISEVREFAPVLPKVELVWAIPAWSVKYAKLDTEPPPPDILK